MRFVLAITQRVISIPLRFKHTRTMQKMSENDVKSEIVAELNEFSPQFLEHRLKLWEKFKARHEEEMRQKVSDSIKVGTVDKKGEKTIVEAQSWKTTPSDIAKQLYHKQWCDSLVISKVNGVLWDLNRPLEADCDVQFLKFDDEEGQQVFWHSSAHILGEAMERLYGGYLCYGPPIDNGFYYDMCMCDEVGQSPETGKSETGDVVNGSIPTTVSQTHFNKIETVMKNICNEKQPFERLELTKAELLEMFGYNRFKVRILNEKVKDDRTTVYRCGTLIDLCRGPHVLHTGHVKAFKVTKTSSSFWEGKADAERLQRIYGISFPDPKQLREWQRFQEEAAKRDHRKIGKEQELFFFHELSPGSCFFYPRGAHIYNTLIDFIKMEYRKRGFLEVMTPNVYNTRLWETSGHWQHYNNNMFSFDVEKEKFALKPMNCPGHCLMFDSLIRSWRELPLRFADFGVLHRNELTGALTGLTRVRRFQQDDAHIFCTPDQIMDEIVSALDFLRAVYSVFGFTFDLCLSTRPESFLGEIEVWDKAEESLKMALDKHGEKWTLNPGDGAFYGPKIDITIKDALRRPHQCATIQLDFQLPIRFDLKYASEDGNAKRPVIIHRAILGSVERFIAILTENYGGKWPFWISPKQAIVLAIHPSFDAYADNVRRQIHEAGFQVDIELDPGLTINKKVRNAQLAQYNFILIVGEKEKENNTVNVRTRDNKVHGECFVDNLIQKFNKFKNERTPNAEEAF